MTAKHHGSFGCCLTMTPLCTTLTGPCSAPGATRPVYSPGNKEARLDLSKHRARFPITRQYAYLNHASTSAPGTHVTEAVEQFLKLTSTTPFDSLLDEMDAVTEQLKQRVAALINAARPDEVAPMGGTAAGINTAANSLPLRPGDNVLVIDGDYPAVIYPWMNLASRGILTKLVPTREGGVDLDALVARIDNRTRVVCLSTAMFSTGHHTDIAAVGALCRDRGLYFVVDCIQTLGAFALDVQTCGIDFLACGSHKWLLSTPGSGFLYCRHELLDELQPGAYVGAFSTVDPWNFLDYNLTLLPSSERFTLGTPNTPGIFALNASLGMFAEVGMDCVSARVLQLTDLLIEDLRGRGYGIVSNREPQRRSGIVVVQTSDAQHAHAQLLAQGIVTSVRGSGLRVSPHYYNTEEEVLRVGEVLGVA